MRLAVLVNAAAGTADRQDTESLRQSLAESFARRGVSAEIVFAPGAQLRQAAEHALQAALCGELDGVVIGGGDGSIRTLAGLLAGSDVPLGILPLGTLNHFARDLALPMAADEAVAVIAAGATRRVDVAEVNGKVFINNSSIGLYPHLVVARENTRPGRWMPKWAATILAAPRILRYFPRFRLMVRVGGVLEPCRSPVVFVGNNEYRLALPAIGTRDSLDGGELAVYVATSRNRLALLRAALRALIGSYDNQDLRMVKGVTAEITMRRHHVRVSCDGEVEELQPPLHYRSRPQALRVFAPPGVT